VIYFNLIDLFRLLDLLGFERHAPTNYLQLSTKNMFVWYDSAVLLVYNWSVGIRQSGSISHLTLKVTRFDA